jgi:hypothetical protein
MNEPNELTEPPRCLPGHSGGFAMPIEVPSQNNELFTVQKTPDSFLPKLDTHISKPRKEEDMLRNAFMYFVA